MNRPFRAESHRDDPVRESCALGPFDDRLRLAVVRQEVTRPPVTGLRFRGRPFAVVDRVRAIVVDALKRVSIRALSHVSVESIKGRSPFIADGDPSAAVIVITEIVRIMAARFHALPRLVCRSTAQAVRSVGVFGARTAARFGVTSSQRVSPHAAHRAADTPTRPVRVIAGAFVAGNGREVAERLTGDIVGFLVSHVIFYRSLDIQRWRYADQH